MKTAAKTALVMLLTAVLLIAAVACRENDKNTVFESINIGEYELQPTGNSGVIKQITVKKGGSTVAVLSTDGTNLTAIDLNFDGYDDIRLNSTDGQTVYQCFIYQPIVGTFTLNSTMSGLLEPVWNSETKTIESRIHTVLKASADQYSEAEYTETRGRAVWKFEGGVLIQVSEEGVRYHSDLGLYFTYYSGMVDGVLTSDYSREHWYDSEAELIADGYVW